MGFHRLTSPSYFGGLPAGYDLINTGAASADSAKVGGPNAGTYFHAFGEPATASNFNRPARALAENCDYLDNLFHRDLAIATKTVDSVGVTNVANVDCPAPAYLGGPGDTNDAAGWAKLFYVSDTNDMPLTGVFGTTVTISGISIGVLDSFGMGISTSPVLLYLSDQIPAGVPYRVHYGTRANLATLESGGLFRSFAHIHANARAHPASAIQFAGGPAWADASSNPAATVEAQLDKIITDLAGATGAAKVGNAGVRNAANAWSGANTFDNISTTASNRYKLTSQIVNRVQTGLGSPVAPAEWFLDTNTGSWICLTATTSVLVIPFEAPDGATITRLGVYLAGGAGHTLPPETPPGIQFAKIGIVTGTLSSIGLVVDSGPFFTTLSLYQQSHELAAVGLTEVVDRNNYRYVAFVITEDGPHAKVGTTVFGVRVTSTVTSMDPGAV